MPSYKNLAMIGLAVSSVSPVLSAPNRSKRATEAPGSRAIAELEGRAPPGRVVVKVKPEGSWRPGVPLAAGVGIVTGALGYGAYENFMNQRDVSPQTVALLNALAQRGDDSDPPEHPVTILHLLARALDELELD